MITFEKMNKEDLSKIVKNQLVFIDTSAFMDERASIFFNKILKPHLIKNNNVYFHQNVYEELENQIKKTEKEIKILQENQENVFWKERDLTLAKTGKKIIDKFFTKELIGAIDQKKRYRKKDIDEVYINIFTELRTKRKLGLITQDKGLSTEIMKLNYSGAVKNKIKGITVLGIDHRSFPFSFIVPKPFKKFKNRHDLSNAKILKSSIDLDIKNTVYDIDNYPYTLYKKIGEGGEGSVYDIKADGSIKKDELCCKIYHKEKLTDLKVAKMELMVSNPLPNVVESYINKYGKSDYQKPFWSIAWPKKVLYNSKDEPVGYLMSKMRNTKPLSAMIGKTLIKKEFPSFETVDLVKVSLKMLKIIKKLHNYNVYIGDIQPDNFLIMQSMKDEIFICLVDVDSFQIERYPCPGGIPEFTHPDRQSIAYEEYLRKEKDECFAVSTLLFNIFMLKLFPYSNTEGGSVQKNMKEKHFPYKLNGEVTDKALPLGKKIWPRLPKYLQKAFIEVFEYDNIVGIDEWENLMNRYREDFKRKQKGI